MRISDWSSDVCSSDLHAALGQWLIGAFYLTIVLAFIGGAAVSTLLINAGRRRQVHAIYAFSIFTEGGLLALLGFADLWLPAAFRGPVLILGLRFLMGLQNAVVPPISEDRQNVV